MTIQRKILLTGLGLVVVTGFGLGTWILLRLHTKPGVSRIQLGNNPSLNASVPSNQQFQSSASVVDSPPPGIADCRGNEILSQLPVSADHISSVTPLGNVNAPGGHVTPSDHIGIGLTTSAATAPAPQATTNNRPGDQQTQAMPEATNLIAPATIHITRIQYQWGTPNGRVNTDYAVTFYPCKQVSMYFGHVPTLSSALAAALNQAKNPRCQGDDQNKFCDYTIDYTAKVGEVIGMVGGPNEAAVGFDFGEIDTRAPALPYLDTALTKSEMANEIYHSGCALDYFTSDLKTQLYQFVGGRGKLRTVEPRCGSIAQDKARTLQGNWFVEGSSFGTWATNLAIVHDNVDPSIGIISIGGTISSAGSQQFTPATSGTINLEPSQTTVGTLYCYTVVTDPHAPQAGLPGKTLLQMTDTNTLKAEHQPGSCTGKLDFAKPTIYSRISTEGQMQPGKQAGGQSGNQGSPRQSPNSSTSLMNPVGDTPEACSSTVPADQQPPGCREINRGRN